MSVTTTLPPRAPASSSSLHTSTSTSAPPRDGHPHTSTSTSTHAPLSNLPSSTFTPPPSCPSCGAGFSHSYLSQYTPKQIPPDPDDAALARIRELEAQVKILTGKATAAVDRLADYEDELRRLKSAHPPSNPSLASAPPPPSAPPNPLSPDPSSSTIISPDPSHPTTSRSTTPTPHPSTALPTRLSSFLTSRLSHTPPPPPSPSHPPPSQTDLSAALSRETALRLSLEGKLSTAHTELEELSTELFQQANEMVASERRARAKLEERVKVLEGRDEEKRRRLERLEYAVGRVERVRGLLREGKS
ncbi:MAG: hypothetical protein M1817_005608 [Caeruleum heppii]|nr:MAG: hypothetical protein M1817_005608 [Caeruleum heppii]